MAIQFFEDDSSKDSSLPFVNEFARTEGALGTEHDVISVAPSRKGNGLVLKTEKFIIFLWKQSKACSFVLNAVKHGEDDCGYPIVAVVTKKDPFYQLGLDTDRTAFFIREEDEFTERISYQLALPQQEMSSESPLPTPRKKGTSPA